MDDSEDVHYLMDEDGEVIHGIYFVADGLEVDDDPDQKIQEVRVYNHDLKWIQFAFLYKEEHGMCSNECIWNRF